MEQEHLILWPFFKKLEAVLSYERWIEKYKIFQLYVTTQPPQHAESWEDIRTLCRLLYLQEFKDRQKFEELLDEAIADEIIIWLNRLERVQTRENDSDTEGQTAPPPPASDVSQEEKSRSAKTKAKSRKQTVQQSDYINRYFHPPVEQVFSPQKFGSTSEQQKHLVNKYLHTDEYLPYSRRQMTKAWQRLRRQQKTASSDDLDIPGIVKNISKNGFLYEPVYKPGFVNRPDTLLIFCDVLGSMTPFHELSERLIATARNLGGHREAGVYYFQNVPGQNVYKNGNLTDPVSLRESLLKANHQHTVTIIISDGGAARGNPDPAVKALRLQKTIAFLNIVKDRTHKILWFNPMPEHRWKNTCAESILSESRLISIMAPVFESDITDPQEWIKKLIHN